MKMGEMVVYRHQNTVRVGRWVKITPTHKAVIMAIRKGNTSFVIRSMKQIYSLPDLVAKYGLGTAEMSVEQQKELLGSRVGKKCGKSCKPRLRPL